VTTPGRHSAALDPLARHRATPEEVKRLIAAVPFIGFRDPERLCLHALAERTTVGRRSELAETVLHTGLIRPD
jgi:hypothetical protein